jgi:hypothetical protein
MSPARRLLVIVAASVAALGLLPAGATARHPLYTGFADFDAFQGLESGQRAAAYRNLSAARGSVVRLLVSWRGVAGSRPPTARAARDPSWPGYDWSQIDTWVREASAAGRRVLLSWTMAPDWAEGSGRPPSGPAAPEGTWRPSPGAYRLFAEAAARRYSGAHPGPAGAVLPRVRYWQAWNEPNLTDFLTPQWTRRRGRFVPASPLLYRRLLNAFYRGVKAVRSGNYVVSAGTAPFAEPWRGARRMPAAYFTRELLCVRGRARPRPVRCSGAPVRFDALAHHPYPIGPPRRTAINRDDVVVPDLWKLTGPLRVALRAGKVAPRRRKGLWATEISWDTNPPDPDGLPVQRVARYLEGALYTLWRQGASVVTWWLMRDDPRGSGYGNTLQSGVYYRGPTVAQDVRKASFYAFRFPFTAYRRRGVAQIWGLAPNPGPVLIEVRRAGRWRPFMRLRRRPRDGLFFAARRVRKGTVLRARQGSESSLTWRVAQNVTE